MRYKSILELLSSQDSSSIAFRYVNQGKIEELTYGELIDKIIDYPLPKENVIGILADINIESIITIFSLIGKKQIVLLNPSDDINVLNRQIKITNVAKILGEEELIEELDKDFDVDLSIDSKDVLFFTSGTTSSSKAVILDEARLCNATYNGGYYLSLNKDDVLFESGLPLSHVFGFVCALLWPLSFGATVALPRSLTTIFEDINILKPTAATLVPQLAVFLASKNLFNPELKLVLIGAGDCPINVLNLIKSKGIRVSFGYGLTESSSGIALSIGDKPKEMSICPDYQIQIGEDGEIIAISDTTLMKGYYKDNKSTNEVLKGNKLYTGDLGKIIDNKLIITGRKKDILVCLDGTKIFLPEYEAKLATYLKGEMDYTVLQDDENKITLYIYTNNKIEDEVDAFNMNYPRGNRIARIIYAKEKLPRTKTNKVQKYMIKF